MEHEELNRMISVEIKRRRLATGHSHSSLAIKMGVTRSWICMMENPKRAPGIPTLIRVCEALECSIVDFFASIFDPNYNQRSEAHPLLLNTLFPHWKHLTQKVSCIVALMGDLSYHFHTDESNDYNRLPSIIFERHAAVIELYFEKKGRYENVMKLVLETQYHQRTMANKNQTVSLQIFKIDRLGANDEETLVMSMQNQDFKIVLQCLRALNTLAL